GVDINADGTWVYEDQDGKTSNTKVESDKKILGNGLPKVYAGWNNNFRFGKVDLGITMRGAFGFQLLNFQRMYSEVPGFKLYNQLQSTYEPIMGKTVLNNNILPEYNSYYVEDGDYWKIDNITLGYNFSLKNPHFKAARVYFSTINTFTISGYKGMDPEVNRLGLSPGNDDRDKYPTPRVYTLGVNVSIN
ncbi:MAG: SusC/RagA family TonB-linked outer membrane protein, partial [Ferruginibacter sp.]|nr:SusC/RagA family TonB-linked outer membrane protein [Ferruginibacter sp.]